MPEKEADHLTPATRLLEKKREMAEVEQALQATKDVCTYVKLHFYYGHRSFLHIRSYILIP